MVKKILLYTVIAIVLFLIAYNVHFYFTTNLNIHHPFRVWDVYLFQAVASLLLVIAFELLASLTTKYKDQLGFIYLASIALKVMLFCILFREVLFSSVILSKSDSLSLLIPIFIFLFYEVFFIAKILNRSTYILNN